MVFQLQKRERRRKSNSTSSFVQYILFFSFFFKCVWKLKRKKKYEIDRANCSFYNPYLEKYWISYFSRNLLESFRTTQYDTTRRDDRLITTEIITRVGKVETRQSCVNIRSCNTYYFCSYIFLFRIYTFIYFYILFYYLLFYRKSLLLILFTYLFCYINIRTY